MSEQRAASTSQTHAGPRSATSRSFTPAFEHLCGFVALTHLQKGEETLKQLLLQTMVLLPGEVFRSADDLRSSMDALFGLQMPTGRIDAAVSQLLEDGHLHRPDGITLVVTLQTRSVVQTRIDNAVALQQRVRDTWVTHVSNAYPKLDPDQSWKALQGYLSRVFRQHVVQTVALLDVSTANTPVHGESLLSILNQVVDSTFPDGQRAEGRAAVQAFLSTVGIDEGASRYVVELADGAFCYYSLVAPPEIAAQLRDNLKELTLLLDTNFLFGILKLHDNSLVAASDEVIEVTNAERLPFKLRYLEVTDREMRRTIDNIVSALRGRHWPQAISRAAARSGSLSGLEQRYHERNAQTPIDVETFFKPYQHIDVLLKDRGILIHRGSKENRQLERATLLFDYQEFLETRHREKPYAALEHDVALLDTAGTLRSKDPSSLSASALCVTCDYLFYAYDWESARRQGHLACTVLPNQFLQLLRPFISPSPDFDRSFAATFAVPEFRTVDNRASLAASRMLALLATYQDFPEETAVRMLANDVLLDRLRDTHSDAEFQAYVESGIAAENQALLEEKSTLAEQLAAERRARAEQEAGGAAVEKERAKLVDELQHLKARGAEERERILTEADEQLAAERRAREDAERRSSWARVAAGAATALLLAVVAEVVLAMSNWTWLLQHQNSYSIRALVYAGLLAFLLGCTRNEWRGLLWGGTIVGGIAIGLLTVLGGPARP